MAMQKDEKPIFEIRDPAVDVTAVLTKINSNMMQHAPSPVDLSATGPASLNLRPLMPQQNSQILNRMMIGLLAKPRLRERPFTSNTPLIGPLIVRLRQAWNWMSTKWYVRPIIEQQAQLNEEMIALLNEMVLQQELSQQKIAVLESQISQLTTAGTIPNE